MSVCLSVSVCMCTTQLGNLSLELYPKGFIHGIQVLHMTQQAVASRTIGQDDECSLVLHMIPNGFVFCSFISWVAPVWLGRTIVYRDGVLWWKIPGTNPPMNFTKGGHRVLAIIHPAVGVKPLKKSRPAPPQYVKDIKQMYEVAMTYTAGRNSTTIAHCGVCGQAAPQPRVCPLCLCAMHPGCVQHVQKFAHSLDLDMQ